MDNKPTILIVDDEPFNVDYLEQELEDLGYATRRAANGHEALAQVQAAPPPDLVLLDIMMPGMDGFQVLQHLKADEQTSAIPVIVISALSDVRSVVHGIDLGAEDYLPKPFDEALLRARITASLEKKRLRDQELEYLRQVAHLTAAAAAVEDGTFRLDDLTGVAARSDALGQLARVFQHMAQEVYAREQRLRQEAEDREARLQQQLRQFRSKRQGELVEPLLHQALDQTPPFDFLTAQEKETLTGRAELFNYPDGWAICGPDDDTYDRLYLLFEGRVALLDDQSALAHVPSPPRDMSQGLLGYIEAPAYFGERSVFFEQPPAARVVARGAARCFVLAGADLRALVAENSMFRQAFATALRNRHRIFYGYETFVNLLFTHAAQGQVQLQDLVDAYRGLESVLHRASAQDTLDLDALSYVIARLPDNMTSVQTLYLAEDLPKMYRDVSGAMRVPSRRAKKRPFYEILPNKIAALLRDRATDTVDLVTKLCIYAVETGKIRQRLSDLPAVTRLAHLAVHGGTPAEEEQVLQMLPFSVEEMARLRELFGPALPRRLYEILAQAGELTLYFQAADQRYTTTATERWLGRIRKGFFEVVTPAEFDGDLSVHIISSNTHSVTNCLSNWLHQRAETILQWAEEQLTVNSEQWTMNSSLFTDHRSRFTTMGSADRLYDAARFWMEACPDAATARAQADRAAGIHVLDDTSLTGIEVSLIDANRLSTPLDPAVGTPLLQGRTLIVNVDYAYGQQAELIMRSLILLFAHRIRSISVFGKSGALVGQRGDLLLPDRLLLQTDDQLYPIPNQDFRAADLLAVRCEPPIHQGTMLTVLGTVMQNREMLHYYRHFWNAIGMEMEGSFYLREIRRAFSLGLIPEDVRLRFAYYTSDTPLQAGESLASSLSAAEGLPAVYAITRAVLRRIIVEEGP